MKNPTWGGYDRVNDYVTAKLKKLECSDKSFAALFELMFSERGNILYERSFGYRMVKTTYGEAYDHILRKTAVLRAALSDAPAGSVVGMYMDNSLEWIEMLWTILRAGYCPLLMNLRLDERTLEETLQSSGAVAVVSDEKQFSVPTVRADAIQPGETTEAAGPFGTDILVMSSGTSRHVKICAYGAAEFASQIRGSYDIICRCRQMKKHYHGQLKQLAFLPFYHIFGLTAVYMWFAFFSRTFVHLQDMAPQTVLNTIRRHEVTHIFAVPLFWETVYDQAIRTIRSRGEKTWKKFQKGMKLAAVLGDVPVLGRLFSKLAFREVREGMFGESICFLITGGSSVRQPVMEFFNAVGYHLADGYGMTEIGITSVELSTRKKVRNSRSVGSPMYGVEYSVSPAGELLVSGRSAARYILCGGEKIPRADRFETHDMAVCKNGRYYIEGRRDDLVIAPNGENLNPNLIEDRFELPQVRGVCLIAAGESGNIVPTLLVSVQRHLPARTVERVRKAVTDRAAQLGLTGQIGRVELIEDELMTGTEFKLNRLRLAEDYAAGRLHPVTAQTAGSADRDEDEEADPLYVHIREVFAVLLDRQTEDISPVTDFFLDGGGSSLDYFALVSQLQNEYAIAFPSEQDGTLATPRALYQYTKAALEHADMVR